MISQHHVDCLTSSFLNHSTFITLIKLIFRTLWYISTIKCYYCHKISYVGSQECTGIHNYIYSVHIKNYIYIGKKGVCYNIREKKRYREKCFIALYAPMPLLAYSFRNNVATPNNTNRLTTTFCVPT